MQVITEEELVAALKEANRKQKDKVCFIQCKLDREDCSLQLRWSLPGSLETMGMQGTVKVFMV